MHQKSLCYRSQDVPGVHVHRPLRIPGHLEHVDLSGDPSGQRKESHAVQSGETRTQFGNDASGCRDGKMMTMIIVVMVASKIYGTLC